MLSDTKASQARMRCPLAKENPERRGGSCGRRDRREGRGIEGGEEAEERREGLNNSKCIGDLPCMQQI